MNGKEALRLDLDTGTFYADWSEETESWAVFGSESDFCYSLHGSERDAERAATRKCSQQAEYAVR